MAAGATYEPIATNTVSGSTTATVTFSSIPSTYTDLVLVVSGTAVGPSDCAIHFNGSQGTNYSWTRIYGNGTAASSATNANQNAITVGTFWTTVGNMIISVQNYSNSTTFKTALSRNNSPSNYVAAFVGMWRSTAAVTSLSFVSGNEYITAGTTLTLYGIKAA
jgi:hypothetical protein